MPSDTPAGDTADGQVTDTPETPDADAADETPTETIDWHTFVPTDQADHLATMDAAAHDSGCGVPWQLLAAIARVESDFGRNMATSSAGAIGYGQFLPSSWASFGNDGNAYDYRDALPAIARYLCQSGLATDPRAALFAYNHADWYVDLVLGLAVRYDRMAPGAPTPDVLDVAPTTDGTLPLHYAAGRNLEQQTHTRLQNGVSWLGVPWRGRDPGAPIATSAMQATALAMLRATFGLRPTPPAASGGTDLASFTNWAWTAGLLARPLGQPGSLQAVRDALQRGQPLVAVVAGAALPGHPPPDATGDQPVVVIGATPSGLIISDPSFSSSLGYGLEIADADFAAAWQQANPPGQALAFQARPRPAVVEAHVAQATPPEPIARVRTTPTPLPTRTPVPKPTTPPPAPLATPAVVEAAPLVAGPADASAHVQPSQPADPSWLALVLIGGCLGVALVSRRRARGSPPDSAAAAPPRSDQ